MDFLATEIALKKANLSSNLSSNPSSKTTTKNTKKRKKYITNGAIRAKQDQLERDNQRHKTKRNKKEQRETKGEQQHQQERQHHNTDTDKHTDDAEKHTDTDKHTGPQHASNDKKDHNADAQTSNKNTSSNPRVASSSVSISDQLSLSRMKSFGTTLLAVQKKLRAINVPVRLFGEKEDAVFLRLIGIERMRMEEGADEFALGKDNIRNAEGEGIEGCTQLRD